MRSITPISGLVMLWMTASRRPARTRERPSSTRCPPEPRPPGVATALRRSDSARNRASPFPEVTECAPGAGPDRDHGVVTHHSVAIPDERVVGIAGRVFVEDDLAELAVGVSAVDGSVGRPDLHRAIHRRPGRARGRCAEVLEPETRRSALRESPAGALPRPGAFDGSLGHHFLRGWRSGPPGGRLKQGDAIARAARLPAFRRADSVPGEISVAPPSEERVLQVVYRAIDELNPGLPRSAAWRSRRTRRSSATRPRSTRSGS